MPTILLAGGCVALVDECDFELVSSIKWHLSTNGYARGHIKQTHDVPGHAVRMHRLILGLIKSDKVEVDHINGDRLDNRRANLRTCTRKENTRNTKISPRNKSGYKGVYWHGKCNLWHARITIKGRNKSLGLYSDPAEAHEVYCLISDMVFGEFSNHGGTR